MTRISLTEPVRAALLTLQAGEAQRARASARLASGLKVNSAIDDPHAYFTAGALSARAKGLNALMDDFGQARGALAAADHAREAIGQLLDQADALLAEAARTPIETLPLDEATGFASATSRRITGLSGATRMRDIAGGAYWHRFDLHLDGETFSRENQNRTVADFQAALAADDIGVELLIEGDRLVLKANRPGALMVTRETSERLFYRAGIRWGGETEIERVVIGTQAGLTEASVMPVANWFGQTIRDGAGGSVYFRTGAHGGRVGDLLERINDANDAGSFAWRADLTTDGRFRLTSTEPTSKLEFDHYSMLFEFVRLGGAIAAPSNIPQTTFGKALPDDVFYDRFVKLAKQIDELAADAGHGGVNLALGDMLSVALNERGQRMTARMGSIGREGLGLNAVADGDLLSTAGRGRIEATLDGARDALRAHATRAQAPGRILDVRQTFTSEMVALLRFGAGDLTLADPNTEGARLLAARTRAQLSSNALRLATRADQAVLALFR